MDGQTVKRMLARAYLEGLDVATAAQGAEADALAAELRRLVTALEVHAILVPGVEPETRRACAFVAAESLSLLPTFHGSSTAAEFFPAFGRRSRYEVVEAALLYLIAAFDANAAVAIPDAFPPPGPLTAADYQPDVIAESQASEWALRHIDALVRLGWVRDEDFPEVADPAQPVLTRVRIEVWRRLGEAARAHLRWLRLEDQASASPAAAALGALLTLLEDGESAAYADQAHLARLLKFACDGTGSRALRDVPPPADPGFFEEYLERRCARRPVLWPSAESYRDACLPGPVNHAAVSMPTGSGKSAVAELAVAQALNTGWVLYLAPTRALVAQVRRDLRTAFGALAEIREFLGGSEFTALDDEKLGADDLTRHVLVMTPEKCSLALRQSPEVFEELSLCVFDECHLIGEPRNRGVLAELVVAQLISVAPRAKWLMQSALLQNPESIKSWLERATGGPCAALREPWRPTRTLRAVAGFDPDDVDDARVRGQAALLQKPRNVHLPVDVRVNLLVNLQGAWAEAAAEDYALARTRLVAPLRASWENGQVVVRGPAYVNKATGSIAQGLADAGHRVLAFIPRNKHYSFSVARDLRGFGDQSDPDDVKWLELEWLLDIADYELGVPSALRDVIRKGVAVHTSAMLPEERRASELAYERGFAKIVFATGTLAQGLNLPATAVVIGGITVGFERDLPRAVHAAREQSQLLNAVGRAGRAYVSARSLAVVLPDTAIEIGPDSDGRTVRTRAPFLQQEDASSPVVSQLGPVLADALANKLTVQTMGPEGLTAFAFLPLRADRTEAEAIISRTYAVAARPSVGIEQVRRMADSMFRLGDGLRDSVQGPDWLVQTAYESGLSLRQITALWSEVSSTLEAPFPVDVRGWAALLARTMSGLPYEVVAETLRVSDLDGTEMRSLAAEFQDHGNAWTVFASVLDRWLAGDSLSTLAGIAVNPARPSEPGRGTGQPLPKMIGFAEHIFTFGTTRLAGGFALMVTTATEQDGANFGWEFSSTSAPALAQLSMAIRAGCHDDGSLGWWRFGGVRHRRLAHLATRLIPPPPSIVHADDEVQRDWFKGKRDVLLDSEFLTSPERTLVDDERAALTAFSLAPR
ncbi:DEAD/DEAH box helicase [Solirubrobacter phytolaccae]|uniref:DEAD/DEAH box helicase n=1 Tax=Solirubrobacter phytolaccae TaxID=1404360 RepID=A0A9X3N3S3_9ACTN|nr:DEAD/DEAH box helicase [Solirubrobacter phytolaccae]MDA0179320.1 DEAD/DEAH box helicase [Solirubrobacter phytolaccae]